MRAMFAAVERQRCRQENGDAMTLSFVTSRPRERACALRMRRRQYAQAILARVGCVQQAICLSG